MPTTKGIDSAVPLTAEKAKAMAAADMKFACRYLVPERYAWKRLTRGEAEAITAAGMKIVSVFETTANRAAGGAAAGQVDGAEAFREAQMIGQPPESAIYFAVDYDAQPKDYAAIEAYLRAAGAAILGNVPAKGYYLGVYGSFAIVEEMSKRIPGIRVWQTYAWSRGQKSQRANIYQYKNGQTLAGHTVDFNDGLGNEGWWDTKVQPVEKSVDNAVDKESAEEVIAILGAMYMASDNDPGVRAAAHYAADALRDAAGLPKK